jgi:predicted RNase H-like HicB family nuclease
MSTKGNAAAFKLEANLIWKLEQTREGNWVGVCQPLGLSVEGGDREELAASIDETVQMMFADLLKSGELDAFLHSQGWKMQPVALPATRARSGQPHFEVPIELLYTDHSGSARSTRQ